MLLGQRLPDNTIQAKLRRAPEHWPWSWNFGIPLELEHVMMPLRTFLETLMWQTDGGAFIPSYEEFHISWTS